MEMTLAQTIKEITRKHLEDNNGLLLGQCISAVGWVNNTVPDCKNIIELPMCDTAGVGFAVGAALAGRKPILVIRYQDFITLGMSAIVNYAAKSNELFGVQCPIFVRLIADEAVGLGPVHSGKLHSLFLQFPGLKIVLPILPNEYTYCWDNFINDTCPYIVCEHRASYNNSIELIDDPPFKSDITLYGISIARFNIIEAQKVLRNEGINTRLVNIRYLKPFNYFDVAENKVGLVVDTGFENGGASQYAAYKIMQKSNQKVYALGLEDKSVGVTTESANQTPSVDKIVNKVKEILGVIKNDGY
jgi:acetoin:2,6-dichlorophenolindophenol oxidoreductase subunit beta